MTYQENLVIASLKQFSLEVPHRTSDMAAAYMIEAATMLIKLIAERDAK